MKIGSLARKFRKFGAGAETTAAEMSHLALTFYKMLAVKMTPEVR
jgi:hypothetical protein